MRGKHSGWNHEGTSRKVWYVIGREYKGTRRIDAGPFATRADADAFRKSERLVGAVVFDVERNGS